MLPGAGVELFVGEPHVTTSVCFLSIWRLLPFYHNISFTITKKYESRNSKMSEAWRHKKMKKIETFNSFRSGEGLADSTNPVRLTFTYCSWAKFTTNDNDIRSYWIAIKIKFLSEGIVLKFIINISFTHEMRQLFSGVISLPWCYNNDIYLSVSLLTFDSTNCGTVM